MTICVDAFSEIGLPILKLSLVIPTRERAVYLEAAIRSALVAADNAECPVQIVVSDNASGDETPAVISGFSDQRIVSRRTERRLSMRENFEFALSHTTGSHIVFIGDDDAVLPHGLQFLGRLISAYDADVVKWPVLNYLWPDSGSGQQGHLKIRPQRLDGRHHLLDSRKVLQGFEQARFRSYHEGGMIYHGCISRRLIERAVAGSGGPYFRGSSPDVFTSLQALLVADRPMLLVNLPITLGGASPRSNGASGQKVASTGGSAAGTEFAKFITESATDPYQCTLPVRCQSLSMVTLDCMLSAAKLHGVSLNLDKAAWTSRIAREIARFAEPARSDCRAMAQEFFGLDIDAPNGPTEQAPTHMPTEQSAYEKDAVTKIELAKLLFWGGPEMQDVAAAAILLDNLVGLDEAKASRVGPLQALGNIFRQRRRARMLQRAN